MNTPPQTAPLLMPAEWERHHATWLGWPLNASDWPGKFAPVRWAFGEIVRKISRGEIARIVVASERHKAEAVRVLSRNHVDMTRIEFFQQPMNRGWMRDCMPSFARKPDGTLAAAKFTFNGWAKYPDWQHDNALAGRLVPELPPETPWELVHAQVPNIVNGKSAGKRTMVLEGGAIDVNGRGTLLTTEECLLDERVQVRNPGMSRSDVESGLRDFLGARNVIWLGRGIVGDDTHGHVDDLCRFVNPRTIVLVQEKNPADENYQALQENRERLQDARLEDGSKPEVAYLPMPEPLVFDGMRLPASYANFYICNHAVLMPTFNDPADRTALGILSELFTDRPVIGIHAVELVWGLGTLHCLTHEEPVAKTEQA
jgi:agmatine deiminase